MSYLMTIIEFIQECAEEDSKINDILQNVHETTKTLNKLRAELKDVKQENELLQIEIHNLEMDANRYHLQREDEVATSNINILQTCWHLKDCLEKIDFERILHYDAMKMEKNMRSEWLQVEQAIARELMWQRKMENRYIVQEYRQIEKEFNEAQNNWKQLESSSVTALEEVSQLIRANTDKRNSLICEVIKISKDLIRTKDDLKRVREFKLDFDELQRRKQQLIIKLENCEIKVTNNTMSTKATAEDTVVSLDLQFYQMDFPKFPSFNEIFAAPLNNREIERNLDNVQSVKRRVQFRFPPEELRKSVSQEHLTKPSSEKCDETNNGGEIEDLSIEVQSPQELMTEDTHQKDQEDNVIPSQRKKDEAVKGSDMQPIQTDTNCQEEHDIEKQSGSIKKPEIPQNNTFETENFYDLDINSEATSVKIFKDSQQEFRSFKMKTFDEYLNLNKNFIFSDMDSELNNVEDYESECADAEPPANNAENPTLLSDFANKITDFSMELSDDSKSFIEEDNFL